MAKPDKSLAFNKKKNFAEKNNSFSSSLNKSFSTEDNAFVKEEQNTELIKEKSREVASNKALVKGLSQNMSHKSMSAFLNNNEYKSNNVQVEIPRGDRKSEFIHEDSEGFAKLAQSKIKNDKTLKTSQFISNSNNFKESEYEFNKDNKNRFIHSENDFNDSIKKKDKSLNSKFSDLDNKDTFSDVRKNIKDSSKNKSAQRDTVKEEKDGGATAVKSEFIHSSRFSRENKSNSSLFIRSGEHRKDLFIKVESNIEDIKQLEIENKARIIKKEKEGAYNYKHDKEDSVFIRNEEDDKHRDINKGANYSSPSKATDVNQTNNIVQPQNQSQGQVQPLSQNQITSSNMGTQASQAKESASAAKEVSEKVTDVADNVDIKKKAVKAAVKKVSETKKKLFNDEDPDANISGDAFDDWKGTSTDKKVVGVVNATKNLTLMFLSSIGGGVKSILFPAGIFFAGILLVPSILFVITFSSVGGIVSMANSNQEGELDLNVNGDGKFVDNILSQETINYYISEINNTYGTPNFFNGKSIKPEVEQLLRYALSKVGCAYNQDYHGSLSVDIFDCSSLAYRAYREVGMDISMGNGWYTAAAECNAIDNMGMAVTDGNLMPGDLLFYRRSSNANEYKSIGHVAIYLGKINIDGNYVDKSVEALGKDYGVVVRDTRTKDLVAVGRPFR